ncbi:hypothetical protein ACOSQ4_017048 [Xanthoceras sorbifolium]
MLWKLNYGVWLKVFSMLGKLVLNLLSLKLIASILLSYLARRSRGAILCSTSYTSATLLSKVTGSAGLLVYREANMLADWMAKIGLQHALGLKYFEDPPTGCMQILDEDATGWPVSRAVFSVF